MQLPVYLGAFLAPALVSAVAFNGPQATMLFPPKIDNWSPAPTKAPSIYEGLLELFKRADDGDNTCGYVSGSYSRSLTCNNGDYVCATNSRNGVHGCCDPSSMAECTIPTSCIPSASLSSCTGDCLTNNFIVKCTNAVYPYCYNWVYVYSNPSTSMLEYGCYTSPLTLTVLRSATNPPSTTTTKPVTITTTSTSSSSSTSTSTSTSTTTTTTTTTSASATGTNSPKVNAGAIAGGVVGGLAVLGAAAAGVVLLLMRSKKKKDASAAAAPMVQPEYKPVPPGPPGMQDPSYPQQFPQTAYAQPPYQQYPPQGQQGQQPYMQQQGAQPYYLPQGAPAPAPGQGEDVKHTYSTTQQQQPGPYSPPGSPAPQYTQMQSFGGEGHGGAQQLDSTPVAGHPQQQQQQPPPQVFEAPSGRE